MLPLSLWLLEILNSLIPAQRMHRELHRAKLDSRGFQERDYEEARHVCGHFGARWDLAGKEVLDVGSGLGGKAAYYADQGADSVTAVDLKEHRVRATSSFARHRTLGSTIRPVVADAAQMPFRADSFDVVTSINVLEHVRDIRAALAECRRVLRHDGLIFLYFPPFYSPWGAHLEGWIDLPWPHVFFSDQTLISVARRSERRRRLNEAYIPSARVDWAHTDQLPNLNRVTVQKAIRVIRSLDLTIVGAKMLPFAWEYLKDRGQIGRGVLSILNNLTRVPLLRECITTKMVFVLEKGQ